MKQFAELLDKLFFTSSNLAKLTLLKNYLAATPDPERGYAIAIISGSLNIKFFKRSLIINLAHQRIDPHLFNWSADYVGDLSETVALIWPDTKNHKPLPLLSEIINIFSNPDKKSISENLEKLLDSSTPTERWALIKLGTGELRIGISARFIKQALAAYGNKDIHDIEMIWHALSPPYLELFSWLENNSDKPNLQNKIYFHPLMLAHPLGDEELLKITPELFYIEWKFDGIRVQIIVTKNDKSIFSRGGEAIKQSFPDALTEINTEIILDGELLIKTASGIASFNKLQQRLNLKKPSKKILEELPCHIVLYDILALEGTDCRNLPFDQRRKFLENWFAEHPLSNMSLSPLLSFNDMQSLKELRNNVDAQHNDTIEGLMIKRKDSQYIPGRPAGLWYKWKRDPYLLDAVLMYAQRGHGKRSSYYSDYTFGLWKDEILLPIGKAYFGFTDEELKQLDKWVRYNTINKFGPVREVAKELVLEVAFEAVWSSTRHKSGYALRFPRIHRIRWDKPAKEADHITSLEKLLK